VDADGEEAGRVKLIGSRLEGNEVMPAASLEAIRGDRLEMCELWHAAWVSNSVDLESVGAAQQYEETTGGYQMYSGCLSTYFVGFSPIS